jgi:hypothetical protein
MHSISLTRSTAISSLAFLPAITTKSPFQISTSFISIYQIISHIMSTHIISFMAFHSAYNTMAASFPRMLTFTLMKLSLVSYYILIHFFFIYLSWSMLLRLPLWSSSQSSWLLTQSSWVRFLGPPNFLHSSGSGTGSTQPCEDKWGATWKKSSGSGLENWD